MRGTAKARRTPGTKVFGDDGWNKRVRLAREAAGLSVEETANAMGVSVSAVRQWEGGHKFPSRENLLQLADICAVDMVYLVTGFSAEELRIAEKIVGMRPVPLLSLGQIRLIEPSIAPPEWPEDTTAVLPSFPCSPQTFAIKVFDYHNSPDFEAGDIVLIDPAVKPLHGDWVLAVVGESRSPFFARHVLHGGDTGMAAPTMADFLQGRVAEAEEKEERALDKLKEVFDKLKELLGEKEANELALSLVPWRLAPLRGGPISLRDPNRVIGTMVEHRHPRRALLTGSIGAIEA
jgi:transcriptional regulator with XRE-family HTH domain